MHGESVPRVTRYQGAIVRGHEVLLIQHRERATGRAYWVIPGGGREVGETEEACVRREMQEETRLEVEVERLLLDEAFEPSGQAYRRHKTYLCRAVGGTPQAGYEPEPEAAGLYEIAEVRWFDLQDAAGWGDEIAADPFTFPMLKSIQQALGYPAKGYGSTGRH